MFFLVQQTGKQSFNGMRDMRLANASSVIASLVRQRSLAIVSDARVDAWSAFPEQCKTVLNERGKSNEGNFSSPAHSQIGRCKDSFTAEFCPSP